MKKALAVALLLLGTVVSGRGQRQDQELDTGWKFIRQDVAPDAATAGWENITVPHSWNAAGVVEDQPANPINSHYYRGPAWYARTLDIPANWQGKRVFLRFEAVSLIAQPYINGQPLPEHRGAFTAFCYELTPYLKFGQPNDLRVRVDNTRVLTVAPLAGDFNVPGGIYRPVHLLVTDPVCVTPLDYASPGMFLTLKSLNAVQAQVEVKTLLSNGLDTAQTLHVAAVVRDAKGRTVFSVSNPVPLAAGTSPQTLVQQVQILNPHLWNGRADPYLYTVAVRVFRGDKMVDEVEQPLGLRTVAITSDGFLLNGKPYPIHGVDRHQDMAGKAWALLPADHQRDLQWLLGMGVTAIRLAHYPQSEYFHDLCDRAGILLWNEVPFVNEVPHPNESPDQPSADTIAFDANLEQQMHEMILQRYNHPAASFWGLFNEISPASAKVALPELKRLNDLAHQLDPSRPTVAASNHVNLPINLVPDHTAFNLYPGWYEPAYADPADHKLAQEIDVRYAELSDRRIGISEYGAGGNPAQHADDPLTQPPANKGQVHPEEWQAYVHERDWAQIKNNPKVWGTFVWVMFDFASSRRNEGDNPGVNDKGLVTQDRQIAKDAYYFYQANWTTQPMVYLTSRRFTPRQNAVTDVKVYSNCPQVELLVNGHSAGVQKPDDICIARWSGIQLQPGNNTITAIGHGAASTPQDSCTWTLAAAPAATATP